MLMCLCSKHPQMICAMVRYICETRHNRRRPNFSNPLRRNCGMAESTCRFWDIHSQSITRTLVLGMPRIYETSRFPFCIIYVLSLSKIALSNMEFIYLEVDNEKYSIMTDETKGALMLELTASLAIG